MMRKEYFSLKRTTFVYVLSSANHYTTKKVCLPFHRGEACFLLHFRGSMLNITPLRQFNSKIWMLCINNDVHCITLPYFGLIFSGPCFTQLCDDMKNAYAPYCRNHDAVIAILEKVCENKIRGHYGCDCSVVKFLSNYSSITYHH